MNQTPNYQLNQWEKTDRIQMEDFNADNAKIEAAILGASEAAAAAAASGLKVVTGSFSGNGTTGVRSYTLGFKPRLLFVFTDFSSSSSYTQGLLITDVMCTSFGSSGNCHMQNCGTPGSLTENGFKIQHTNANLGLNVSGSKLFYWALY